MPPPRHTILLSVAATGVLATMSGCLEPDRRGDTPADADVAPAADVDAGHDATSDPADASRDGDVPDDASDPDPPESGTDTGTELDGPHPGPTEPCIECLVNPVWDLRIDDQDWERLLADVDADVRVPAVLTVDGTEYDIGVELQGSTSRRYPKRSLKLHFDDDGPLIRDPFGLGETLGFDELILKASYKDQSFVREALAWELLRRLDLHAPRTSWVNVTLDGEYHGLFVLTEPIDRDYLRRRGFEDEGNLYKALDQVATMRPSMVIEEAFEKRTNEDEPWDDLHAFVDLLQQTPATAEDLYADIDPIWPLDEWLDRLVWVSFTQNLDSWRNNFFLYNEGSVEEPAWTTLAWDSDICFAQHWRNAEATYDVEWSHMLDGHAYFGERIMEVDEIRHDHVEHFREILESTYAPDAVVPTLDAMIERVADDARVDLEFWDRTSSVETELGEIRDFLERRPDYLRAELDAFYDDPDIPDYRE